MRLLIGTFKFEESLKARSLVANAAWRALATSTAAAKASLTLLKGNDLCSRF